MKIEKTFIEIIQRHERIIYKICYVYTTPELPIPDLYQEVVCNLWAGFAKFRHECSVSTWIYRVAINTCITETRKDIRRPKNSVPVDNLSESLLSPESLTEDIREMYRLISQLRTIEKTVVLLYLEEKSYQEIADITGLTLSNVAIKLKRSKEKLKQLSNL